MIIVTPAVGWPEPRPQSLITGDRAISVLDTASSAALQKAGVKLVTVPGTQYQELVDQLVPEVFDGLDPATGLLKETVIPSRLSAAALADIDLRGGDGHIEEQFLPTRLSNASILSMIAGLNSTVSDTDPDGTPVILASAAGSVVDDWTVTGTATVSDLDAATGHVDSFTTNQTTNVYTESALVGFPQQVTAPASPAAGKVTLYGENPSGRLVWKDSSAITRRVSNIRVVTSWPVDAESFLGDEAVISATGEHRVYKGTTLGWRLASGHTVSTLTDRNAITNKYPGYKVYCNFGVPQEMVYGADSKWHGTKSFLVDASPGAVNNGTVQDANWRRFSTMDLVDPGYDYYVTGNVMLVVTLARGPVSSFLNIAQWDYQASTGLSIFSQFGITNPSSHSWWNWHQSSGTTAALSGSHTFTVDWRVDTANVSAALIMDPAYRQIDYTVWPV